MNKQPKYLAIDFENELWEVLNQEEKDSGLYDSEHDIIVEIASLPKQS